MATLQRTGSVAQFAMQASPMRAAVCVIQLAMGLGRQHKMAQVHGPEPSIWLTWMAVALAWARSGCPTFWQWTSSTPPLLCLPFKYLRPPPKNTPHWLHICRWYTWMLGWERNWLGAYPKRKNENRQKMVRFWRTEDSQVLFKIVYSFTHLICYARAKFCMIKVLW